MLYVQKLVVVTEAGVSDESIEATIYGRSVG